MKKLTSLLLSLSLIYSSLAQAGGEIKNIDPFMITLSKVNSVNSYVSLLAKTKFAYRIDENEFAKSLKEGGINGVYIAQVQKALDKTQGSSDSGEQMNDISREEAAQAKAFEIVDKMFKQKDIVQMNIELLSIMHDYLFNDEARGPLQYIIGAIQNYHFSDEQMHDLQKRAMPLKQFTNGILYTWAAVVGATIVAAVMGRETSAWEIASSAFRKIAKKTPSAVVKSTESESDIMLRELARTMGNPRLAQVAKPSALQMAAKLKIKSYFNWLVNHPSFKNFVVLTGLSTVGGATNVGVNALIKIFSTDTIESNYINPADFQSKYDGLAVLNLTCESYDLYIEAKDKVKDPLTLLKKLNSLYVDYTIMQHLSPRYMEKVTLPPDIQADGEHGVITMNLNIKGHLQKEEVFCAKYKGFNGTQVDVDLAEVLYELSQTYLLIDESEKKK